MRHVETGNLERMVVRGGGCGWMHAAPALRPLKFEGRPGNQEAPGKTTPANEEARQRPEAHANYEKIGRQGAAKPMTGGVT